MQISDEEKSRRAFRKGWKALNDDYKPIVREEIKEELRLKTDNAFMLRRSGVYHHKPCEITAIEKVFNKYGVINPWGE